MARGSRGLDGPLRGGEAPATDAIALTYPEWLGQSLDRAVGDRRDRGFARLCCAWLRHQAPIENVDYRAARGLDRTLFQKLADAVLDRRS